jgi:hypothetical protein
MQLTLISFVLCLVQAETNSFQWKSLRMPVLAESLRSCQLGYLYGRSILIKRHFLLNIIREGYEN